MNSTIDESKEYIVGGWAVLLPEKDRIVEMKEEEARDAEEVVDNILMGQLQEIKVGKARAEDILSKAQIKELEKNRKNRKTRQVAKRKETEAR